MTLSPARVLVGVAIATVAVVAGVVSYIHICELSLALHQDGIVSHLMPFGVDGMITMGSLAAIQGTNEGWIGVALGITMSLFANVESGIRYGTLSAVWAGVPAIAFAVSCFILERWLVRQSRKTTVAAQSATETAPEPAAPVTAPKPVREAPARAPRQRKPSKPPARGALDLRGAELAFASHLHEGRLPGLTLIRKTMHCGHAQAAEYQEYLRAGLDQTVTA